MYKSWCCACALAGILPSFASAQTTAPAAAPAAGAATATTAPALPANRRSYLSLRYDEDWRWLGKPHPDHDFFDPVKYIPLTSDGDLSLSIGGSMRFRYENKVNAAFGATNAQSPSASDDYWLQRYYLHMDLRYKDAIRLFAEGVAAYIDGNDRNPPPTPNPADEPDLHQLFLDLSPLTLKANGFGLTLRAGRQELLYDKQKLVGTLDWANVRRSFDGFKFLTAFGKSKLDLFWVRPVQVNPDTFDTTDEQTNFAGIHLTQPLFKDHTSTFFVYYLNRNRDTKTAVSGPTVEFNPNRTAGNTDRVTIGSHFWGKSGPWDYDIEGGVQLGQVAQDSILAGYVSVEAGYTFTSLWAKPRLSVGYDYATGDEDPNDGQLNTFDQLFPTGHLYFGYMDFIGRQNINSGNVTLTIFPHKDIKVWTSWHPFWLASGSDALYNAGGQAYRYSPTGNKGSYVGNEIDLTGSWQIGRHTSLLMGYGIFFPGTYIQNTGPSQLSQFVYASIEFKF